MFHEGGSSVNRVFVLSPASCNGLRARWVLKKNSRSDLAIRLRSSGVALGEVFTYVSLPMRRRMQRRRPVVRGF
jgi:hypothetical protein